MCAILEGLMTLWSHIDTKIPILNHIVIPLGDSLVDEEIKILTNNNSKSVDYILSGSFHNLLDSRIVFTDIIIILGELDKLLHLQQFIVWHSQMLDFSIFDNL